MHAVMTLPHAQWRVPSPFDRQEGESRHRASLIQPSDPPRVCIARTNHPSGAHTSVGFAHALARALVCVSCAALKARSPLSGVDTHPRALPPLRRTALTSRFACASCLVCAIRFCTPVLGATRPFLGSRHLRAVAQSLVRPPVGLELLINARRPRFGALADLAVALLLGSHMPLPARVRRLLADAPP